MVKQFRLVRLPYLIKNLLLFIFANEVGDIESRRR